MAHLGKILVADDDETFRETTMALLEQDGFEVVGVANAESALTALRGHGFELALVDINMPGNSDLALVRELAALSPGLPVILVTGYPSVQTAVSAVNLSTAAYLLKPVATDELLHSVRRVFEQRRACRTVEESVQRLSQWNADLQALSRSIRPKADHAFDQSLCAFVTLTVRNVSGALLDIRNVVHAMVEGNVSPEAMKALESSRPLVLVTALQDAVRAIERTKVSFKSRELAELRLRLENLLREEPVLGQAAATSTE